MFRAALSGALFCVALGCGVSAFGQLPARLTRPAGLGDSSDDRVPIRADETIAQVAVDYYDRMQRQHGAAYPLMDDAFVCRSGTAIILRTVVKTHSKHVDEATRALFRKNDQAAMTSLAIEAVAELDKVDPAAIRADEAIGPGVYHPAITAIAYTIGRCRFY